MANDPFLLKRHAWDALGFCACGLRRVMLGAAPDMTVLFFGADGRQTDARGTCPRPPRRQRRPAQLALFKS